MVRLQGKLLGAKQVFARKRGYSLHSPAHAPAPIERSASQAPWRVKSGAKSSTAAAQRTAQGPLPLATSARMSRAEQELALLQTYAPNWRPKPRPKKRRPLPQGGSATLEIESSTRSGSLEQNRLDDDTVLAHKAVTYKFPVDTDPSRRGPGKGKKQNVLPSGRRSAEPLRNPKAVLPATMDPTYPSKILSDDQRKEYRQLPRPKSVGGARPPTSTGKDKHQLSTPGVAGVQAESDGDGPLKGFPDFVKLNMKKLKPKLRKQQLKTDGSISSQVSGAPSKALDCPECLISFAGICTKHLRTTWQASLKTGIEDEERKLQEAMIFQRAGGLDGKLRVQVFTAAEKESRGKIFSFAIEPQQTLSSLKHRIMKEEGTPTMYQRLIYRGRSLDGMDDETLQDVGIDGWSKTMLFVVLQPPIAGVQIPTGCDFCANSTGGVCTRHLRDKRRDLFPRAWIRHLEEEDRKHETPQQYRGDFNDLRKPVVQSLLRSGHPLLQLFRVEMLQRFNSAFDAWIYFDMDGDGSITLMEFQALCRPLKLTAELDDPRKIEEVFNQIDIKEKLLKLWPFTFIRQLIWHETDVDLRKKDDIYVGIDASRVNRKEILRLAQARSCEKMPVFEGINDTLRPSTGGPAGSPSKALRSLSKGSIGSRAVSAAGSFTGCPMCEKAMNGKCHRCLPVYRNGVPVEIDDAAEQQVEEVLQIAADARRQALAASTPNVFFELDGIECGKGSAVSVLFENDSWHTGYLDAYQAKTLKVRIRFLDPRIGVVHACMTDLQIKPADLSAKTQSSRAQGKVVDEEKIEGPDDVNCSDKIDSPEGKKEVQIIIPHSPLPSLAGDALRLQSGESDTTVLHSLQNGEEVAAEAVAREGPEEDAPQACEDAPQACQVPARTYLTHPSVVTWTLPRRT